MEDAYLLLNECLHFVPSNSELYKEIIEALLKRAEQEADDRAWMAADELRQQEYEAEQETYFDPRCGCPDHYYKCPIHGPNKSYECPNCHGLNGLHSGMDECPPGLGGFISPLRKTVSE